MNEDNWKHRGAGMLCRTCISFVPKVVERPATPEAPAHKPFPVLGRCRKRAPTMGGFPVVFENDWCGDHKLDEQKI